MLLTKSTPSTSENYAKSGDIYRFNPEFFWEGEWIEGGIREPEESFITITRKEYLSICSEVPKSGCITLNERSHAALYKILLGRAYPHFGITGIKTIYLIKCIDGDFGRKYIKTTSHEAIRKLIGGRAHVSHASDKFWKVCYQRIREEDVTGRRQPLKDFTEAEREIWRAFVRRASISCNRKKLKQSDDRS